MLEVKILDLNTLKGKEKTAYKKLAGPDYRGCLSGADPFRVSCSELLAIGASENGVPVGLLLGAFRGPLMGSEVYSLNVAENCSYPAIANLLLKHLVDILKAKGATFIRYVYQLEQPWTEELEKILEGHHWENGAMTRIRLHFNAPEFDPLWMRKEYPVPPGCTEFFWKDLAPADKEHLKSLIEQCAIPEQISPFNKEHQIDWNTSLGLRNEKGVVGWMVNLRPKNDLIEYRSLFVFREYYSLGHAIRLLKESIRLMQKKNTPRHAVFEVHPAQVDSRWIEFIKKRLLPYAEKVERFREASIKLSS